MKILLLSFLSLFLLGSCAQHHKKDGEHHHHNCTKSCSMHSDKGEVFNKHCAMSVSMGDMHVAGKKEFSIVHAGETYYFSSKEKMEVFQENIEENISKARKFWITAGQR